MNRFAPGLALLGCLLAAPAAALTWNPTYGPEGAIVLSMTRTPAGSLLVGTEGGGLYRSTDDGGSWSRSESGLAWPCCNFNVPSLATNAGEVVYAGTWGGGVFRSTDDGQSWEGTAAIPGDGYAIVQALAAYPRTDVVCAGGNFGVAVSEDRGASWTNVSGGLPGDWIRSLAVLGATAYALGDGGLFRLPPGATTWLPFTDGLPGATGLRSLRVVGSALALATHAGGVYVLNAAGDSWLPLNAGIEYDHVEALAAADDELYAGLMGGGVRRLAGGASGWTVINDGLWNDDVRCVTQRLGAIFGGSYGGGVFRFDAASAAWTARNTGLVAPSVRRLAADGTHLYSAAFGGGVSHTPDQGQTWELVLNGLANVNVLDVATQPGAVFAATWNGVYRSADHGQNWSPSGLQGHGAFVVRNLADGLHAGLFDVAVMRSSDGGANWTQLGNSLPTGPICGIARLGSSLYAAVDGQGVYQLPDGGTTWTLVNTGLPGDNVLDLVTAGGNLLVATGTEGVYRWVPGSSSWVASGLGGQPVFSLGLAGTSLYAGVRGTAWMSDDGGLTWNEDGAGLPEHLAVRGFAWLGSRVFVAVEAAGVYRLGDPTSAVQPDPLLAGRALAVAPNPALGATRVRYRNSVAGPVRLDVLDPAGRRVATLVSGTLPPGTHERVWDGRDARGRALPAGLYFLRLQAGGRAEVTRVTLTH